MRVRAPAARHLARAFPAATVALTMLVGADVGLTAPLTQTQTPIQDELTREDQRWRATERAGAAVAALVSPWPVAYPREPRPPTPLGRVQRLYPWELLGSPFVPVIALVDVRYMGIQPSTTPPAGGPPELAWPAELMRGVAQPLAFRVNYREAAPYITAGNGPMVLDAWARYLGREAPNLPRPITPEELTRTLARWLCAEGYLLDPPAGEDRIPLCP